MSISSRTCVCKSIPSLSSGKTYSYHANQSMWFLSPNISPSSILFEDYLTIVTPASLDKENPNTFCTDSGKIFVSC